MADFTDDEQLELDPDRGPSLAEAKQWLRERVRNGGAECPCCAQFAKVYTRKIHATMAADLIRCYRAAGMEEFSMPRITPRGDTAKLRYWGLLLPIEGDRDDGSWRNGRWRITVLGQRFIMGKARIRRECEIYDSKCLGLVGDFVSITDCLGDHFDYRELMQT
jgi:hypothetical protein